MGIFSNSCDKCGSTEHAFEDCPHSFFSKACSKCGSTDHTFDDCPHSFFSKACSKCGSTEHAYEDCPHSFFSKECSKCGSVNHATQDCPQGIFARPPRERAKSDDDDDDDLAGGLIKLGLIIGAIVFIFWIVFNVILPFIAINIAVLALVGSLIYKDKRRILYPASLGAGMFSAFDYNYGIFVGVLQSSVDGSLFFIKYMVLINFVAGLVSAYLIGERIISRRAGESEDDGTYSKHRSILIGSLAFVGIGGIGTQYYFDSKNDSGLLEPGIAVSSSPDLGVVDTTQIGPEAVESAAAPEPSALETEAIFSTDKPEEKVRIAGSSVMAEAAGAKQREFVGYSQKDSCFGTVYRKSGCGSMDNLSFGGWGDYYYVFVEFDIDGLPDIANGGGAEIWLWGSAPNDPGLVIERVTQGWSESSLSSNNYPASTPFARAPSIPASPNWIKMDITNLYKSWKAGTSPNFGIKLTPRRNGQTNGAIASSESANADIRPRLVVTPVN